MPESVSLLNASIAALTVGSSIGFTCGISKQRSFGLAEGMIACAVMLSVIAVAVLGCFGFSYLSSASVFVGCFVACGIGLVGASKVFPTSMYGLSEPLVYFGLILCAACLLVMPAFGLYMQCSIGMVVASLMMGTGIGLSEGGM